MKYSYFGSIWWTNRQTIDKPNLPVCCDSWRMRKMRTLTENMACAGEVEVVWFSSGQKLSLIVTAFGRFIGVQNFCTVINEIYWCDYGFDGLLTKFRRSFWISWLWLQKVASSMQGTSALCGACLFSDTGEMTCYLWGLLSFLAHDVMLWRMLHCSTLNSLSVWLLIVICVTEGESLQFVQQWVTVGHG